LVLQVIIAEENMLIGCWVSVADVALWKILVFGVQEGAHQNKAVGLVTLDQVNQISKRLIQQTIRS
jgi:hypothetical protein